MNKGFARDEKFGERKFRARFLRECGALNEKFPDCARKNSLTVCNSFITHSPTQPSDVSHQTLN
jgi:hypothetical protein